MYRPEGWENPHSLTTNNRYMGVFDKHYAYEAGADAILEAISKLPPTLIEGKGGTVTEVIILNKEDITSV